MILQIMLACNDPNTGNHLGQVDQIEVPDYILQAEGPPVSCELLDSWRLELAGHTYKLKGYGTWVGNWCWDCATLPSVYVAEILKHLRSLGWSVIEAENSLFEKWQAGERITAGDLERLGKEGS